MSCEHHCSCPHAGAVQTLDELDFERGIWYAAQHGDLIRVKKLADDYDKKDCAGYTALHYAARNGKLEVCQFLVQQGADVNATTRGGATALSRAALQGKTDVVEYLLSKKADPMIQDVDGKTALHRAYENRHLEICKLLLKVAPTLKNICDHKGNRITDFG